MSEQTCSRTDKLKRKKDQLIEYPFCDCAKCRKANKRKGNLLHWHKRHSVHGAKKKVKSWK